MEMKARRMVFPTHYFTCLSTKIETVLILLQKMIAFFLAILQLYNPQAVRKHPP